MTSKPLVSCAIVLAVLFPGCNAPPAEERVARAAKAVATDLAAALAAAGASAGDPLFIRIFKEEAELEVWLRPGGEFRHVRTYDICYYSGDLGPKLREGDRQSPEGFYFVNRGRMNPNSRFHLAFNIGYPNAYDRAHGRTGGFIMVHGDCVSIGCYAMTDAGIEEIYGLADAALGNGQPFFRVHVFPFRMTAENMRRHEDSAWLDFWENLKEGYDLFESHGRPPDVRVESARYAFRMEESEG
jgi:murein L,D-transpeptidase YafK